VIRRVLAWTVQGAVLLALGDGFDDRYVQVGTTFGGAGVIRGGLTPECATAVRAVLDALGKKAGPDDDRTEGKRFHDALQLACALSGGPCCGRCALEGRGGRLAGRVPGLAEMAACRDGTR
jgi:hypothetical protein